jgi:hypothetical protein
MGPITVEQTMNRRIAERRNERALVVEFALGDLDPRSGERRRYNRRRGDARSVTETLVSDSATVMFSLGARERKSAVYGCGCVAVDPLTPMGSVQLLQCQTHAALQAKLRRRQTDRV